MLKNLHEGQKKVARVMKMYFVTIGVDSFPVQTNRGSMKFVISIVFYEITNVECV